MKQTLFGTDGIRGPVGEKPFTLHSLITIGNSIAQWAQHKYGPHPRILLVQDTRTSCDMIKSALKSGLLLLPTRVYDAHILPSPAVLQLIRTNTIFDCGIIISASHNPYYDNGLKIIGTKEGKLSKTDEEMLCTIIEENRDYEQYNQCGTEFSTTQMAENYEQYILNMFNTNLLSGRKVVLDCAHGATYKVAPSIFKKLGAECVLLNTTPNGTNINDNCGTLFPEKLGQEVVRNKADIGFAFDGDGDRVICVNRHGQIKDGDDALAILIHHPDYRQTKTITGTIMSNQGLELYLKNYDKILTRTAVGDKYIAEYLTSHNLLLGGEPSGHIILNNYLPTGDGIFTALKIAETVSLTDNWDMQTFIKFPQIIINIPVKYKKDLTMPPLSDVITASSSQLHKGRLIVRYSGTEPLLRIMVEDDTAEHAQLIGSMLSQKLLQEIS